MKTSKKLLSLFLSLVMIITSCSVGFTAFAADGNNTDSNNDYWNNVTSADKSFESVESLLGAIIQIDAVKNLLQDNNIVNPVTQATTLKDVVGGASPVLLKLLGGLGTLDIMIAQIELSWTKDKFLEFKYGNKYTKDKDFYDEWYIPLDTPEGDDSDLLTFYQLYGLCYENQDADSDFGKWCKDTLKDLEKLFDSLGVPEKADEQKGDIAKMYDYLQSLYNEAAQLAKNGNNNYTLADLENAELNGKALKDTPLSSLEGTDGELAITYFPKALAAFGIAAPSNMAELLYYAKGEYEQYAVYYNMYFKLLEEAGATVDTHSYPGVSGTTGTEIADSFKSFYNWDFIKNNGFISTYNYWDYYADIYMGDERDQKAFDEYYNAFMFGAIFLNDWDPATDGSWTPDYDKDPGTPQDTTKSEKYNYDGKRDVVSPYYKDLTKGLAKLLGASESDYAVSDAQLEGIYNAAKSGTITDSASLSEYANENLGAPAAAYIDAVIAKNASAVDTFVSDLAAADDFSNALAVELNNGEEDAFATEAKVVGGLRRIQAMAASQWIKDEILKGNRNPDKSIYYNTDVVSALNLFEVYNTYVSNPDLAPEISDEEEEEPEKIYFYKDFAIPKTEYYVEAVNFLINKFMPLLEDPTIQTVVLALLETPIDLKGELNNIWKKLYAAPAETLFKLLPVLTVLIDELILPTLIHDDAYQNELEGMIFGLALGGMSQAQGSDIGLGTLHLDLNKSLPAILYWILGDQATALSLIGYQFHGDVPVVDKDGNPVLDEDGNQVIKHYEPAPKFTDIYILDGLVASKLDSPKAVAELLAGLIKADDPQGQAELVPMLTELVESVVKNVLNAVLDTQKALKDHQKKAIAATEDGGYALVPSQTALNDLPVALPYLIDALGKNFNTRNKVDSDWTFLYDGKITTRTFKVKNGEEIYTYDALHNAHIKKFKNFAVPGSGALPSDILAHVVDLLIGNWINALLDFLNDNIMDSDIENQFIGKLPLVQGLLEALGGFGDTSVITDALNGLFQLKRCDDASFTLTEREKTKFVGFSQESAFFLINNLLFIKGGEARGLIPFIQGFSAEAPKTEETPAATTTETTPALTASTKVKTVANKVTDYDKLLTEENKAAAQTLIDILDELLASLLKNTSLNGFDLDSTENLLSGAVTLFAAYFGGQNTNDLLKLLNNYLFFVVGERSYHPATTGKIGNDPTAEGNVDKDKVYTSANLSNLVIQTYSFLENIVDYFFYQNNGKGVLINKDKNELVADALYGIVSPDAVAMRLTKDYEKTAKILKKKDYHNWNSFKVEITALDAADVEYNTHDYLKYGFKKGDKDGFYKALGESFNGVAAILGAVFATSYADAGRNANLYSTVLYPLLNTLGGAVGAKAPMSVADYNKAYAEKNFGSTLVDGLLLPVGNILAPLYSKPFTFILNLVKGLGGVLRDSSIAGILGGLGGTVNLHLSGLAAIVAGYTPTGAQMLMNTINNALSGLKIGNISIGDLLSGKGGPMQNVGSTLLRSLLGDALPFIIPDINFDKLYASKTPAETLLLIYAYVIDTALGWDLITNLIKSLDPEIAQVLSNINSYQLFGVIVQVIKSLKSPTEAFWSFSEYAKKIKSHYKYPNKLTAAEALGDVAKLDKIVENVFPLLNSFGVTDIQGLPQLINDKLYTNEIITKLAKALYGAITGNSTVAGVLAALNIDASPAGLASYLTDKSYGKTYTSAAKTLKKAKSWDDVKKVNWGFTDKTANAQNGFINGLSAALRPLNNVLSLLLCEGDLDAYKIDTKKLVAAFEGQGGSTEILTDKGPESKVFAGKHENAATLDYKLKGSKLYLTVQSYNITGSGHRTTKSELIIDLEAIANDVNKLLGDRLALNFGTNGYESAIIPLLEAFKCRNIKTYKQYKKDYKKAKDNLLINILKPIGALLDDLAAAPFDTLTDILPNLAYFIDSNGISQAVGNLLAPILSDDGVYGVLKKNGVDLGKLIETITGKKLGDILADFLDYDGKITLELNNLKSFNIQDIVYPLVSKLVKDNYGLKLPKFTWKQIASHGTIETVRSAARNDKGKFTTRQVDARQGEVLFSVLTYVAKTLIVNANALKDLLGGIDAIKNNETIKKILDSILDNVAVAKPDDITGVIVYLLNGRPTDKFFDYRNFKYKESNFSFGELDEDFCRQLAPMLDGLIKGLINDGEGLPALINEKLYTDDLVAKAATGIYGAIEGVNVGDGSLTDLLVQTNIDMTTDGVAKLLTDTSYGRSYPGAASVIRKAGSWSKVKAGSLKFGVKDRDSFLHALTAVLRPLFGVLDVLFNDASLNLFNMVDLPGSDGYTSAIVPLLEALGVYNIKTQYQYREDIYHEYDNILLDILNPLWDKVEDVLNAPLETVADMLPNLALFFANGGLAQVLDNLLTPITALLDALKPIANINDILDAAGLNVPKLLKDKVGITLDKFDLYDLQGTLNGVIGAEKVVPLLNSILPMIKIGGAPLKLELPDIDWLQLASCGELITDQPSQVACYGRRISVKSDQDITLITVLRYLVKTINYKGNYDAIVDLVGGIDGMSDTVAQVVGEVLGMLQGDTDEVIASLIDLLQSLAG